MLSHIKDIAQERTITTYVVGTSAMVGHRCSRKIQPLPNSDTQLKRIRPLTIIPSDTALPHWHDILQFVPAPAPQLPRAKNLGILTNTAFHCLDIWLGP